MIARDSYQDSMEDQNSDPDMQADQDEEAEETLSFCDLPIYNSNAADWENFSKEDQSLSSSSSSSSSSDEEFFEFFSEDWSSSNAYPVENNIVFCGRVIPFKEPVSNATHKLESNESEKPRKRGLLQWNSKWFSRQRSSKANVSTKGLSMNKSNQPKLRYVSSSKSLSLPVSEKYRYKVAKGGEKSGFSVPRVSILASPAKSRRHLLMFGVARLPAEIELSDIRSRQSRRRPSVLFRPGGGDEKVSRRKGLWGMVRALGCGDHATAVINAKIGCNIPCA